MSILRTATDWDATLDRRIPEATHVGESHHVEGISVDVHLEMGPRQLRDHLDVERVGFSG